MRTRAFPIVPFLLLAAACAPADEAPPPMDGEQPGMMASADDDRSGEALDHCAPMADRMALEGRASPYDSARVALNGEALLVCYGRPAARERTMLGGNVPHGQLWRTGANEPTTIHVPVAVEIAGIPVEPGSYSFYTIPGEEEWTVVVNRSIDQWGHESSYSSEVEAQEVGRATVPASSTAEHVEQFTISGEEREGQRFMVLEWERTRVAVPVRAAG